MKITDNKIASLPPYAFRESETFMFIDLILVKDLFSNLGNPTLVIKAVVKGQLLQSQFIVEQVKG